ncbi:nuclear receptor-interacting protein 3 [Paramormyrops kingsleyae]|uniref:Nuclear receptor interacting protein 3 n=1 Tax=Paramormyrops kingsleyae TaxID=1676925 RepID=A0A3B3SRH7_9TELE|nr:nuclear receptor-interacting protein 3 [Paramormyrops kingsleyae]
MLHPRMRSDGNMENRESAAIRQQRRMKQTLQFIHKDSADLLPLDGLKKLGTSKEMQPHNILQRRLMDANMSRCKQNNRGVKPPNNGAVLQSIGSHLGKQESFIQPEEDDYVFVNCKCWGRETKVLIDTGCKANLMSTACVERLGLKERVNMNKTEMDSLPLWRNLQPQGHIEKVTLVIGQVKIECTVTVVEHEKSFMSLGARTLKSQRCVIDMEKQMLVLGRVEREQVQFVDCRSGLLD